MNEALLQNLYIIVSIISGAIGIIYAIRHVTRWFQNLDRQIRDMRVGLHAISSLIYALYSTFLKKS